MSALAERWLGRLVGKRFPGMRALHFFRRDPLAVLGAVVVVGCLAVMIFAPWLTPYPEEGRGDPNMSNKLLPPSPEHRFGTDQMGRDVLARIIFGSRVSVPMGVLVALVAVLIGVPIGAISGYAGGWLDEAIMRVTDVFLAFPPLLLAIAIAAALGRSFTNAMLAIALTWWPWYARLVRSQALSLRQRSFVDAARCMGLTEPVIILRHVLPHTLTPVLVQASLDIGSAILAGAGLSFLGLGVRPPVPDWGRMVSEGRLFFLNQWWVCAFPGLSIFLVVLAFNLVGDALRDWLDPRMRAQRQWS